MQIYNLPNSEKLTVIQIASVLISYALSAILGNHGLLFNKTLYNFNLHIFYAFTSFNLIIDSNRLLPECPS